MKKILYHGSDVILKKPLYGVGKEDNDYGSGFYTTENTPFRLMGSNQLV